MGGGSSVRSERSLTGRGLAGPGSRGRLAGADPVVWERADEDPAEGRYGTAAKRVDKGGGGAGRGRPGPPGRGHGEGLHRVGGEPAGTGVPGGEWPPQAGAPATRLLLER